jgi:hypothetical protein
LELNNILLTKWALIAPIKPLLDAFWVKSMIIARSFSMRDNTARKKYNFLIGDEVLEAY